MIPKFRAWDKAYKMMMVVNQIDFEDRSLWLEADNGDHETRHTITRDFDEVILMQSTGLKDQNGVEIYEGDIIEWRYVITYVDSSQQGNLGMSIGFYAQRDDFESYHMLGVGDEYEVLGNVYENPELLEVE